MKIWSKISLQNFWYRIQIQKTKNSNSFRIFSQFFFLLCETNKHINQTRYITSLVEVILSLFSLMNSYWDLKYVCYCLVSLEYLTQEANTTGFRSKMIYFSYKEKLIIFTCAFQDLYFTILSLTVVNYRSTRY